MSQDSLPATLRIPFYLRRNRRANSAEVAAKVGCDSSHVRRVRNSLKFLLAEGPSTAEEERRLADYIQREREAIKSRWSDTEAIERRTGLCPAEQRKLEGWSVPVCELPLDGRQLDE